LLLRRRGFPAKVVIGVRKIPFLAHAWVELEGQVVGDHDSIRSKFIAMEKL